MTPPPMMTTRARPGSSGWSVIALRLAEQAGEISSPEPLDRPVEALHRPGPEVEVDRAGSALDGTPQRPPVLARKAKQAGAGDLAVQRPAVIRGDQLGQAVQRQTALAPDIAELEARVVIARVLIVDQADPLAVVDQVGGQQVVVARDRAAICS